MSRSPRSYAAGDRCHPARVPSDLDLIAFGESPENVLSVEHGHDVDAWPGNGVQVTLVVAPAPRSKVVPPCASRTLTFSSTAPA